jgi:hypothetical protein
MSAGVILANQQGLSVSIDSAATLKNKIVFEDRGTRFFCAIIDFQSLNLLFKTLNFLLNL